MCSRKQTKNATYVGHDQNRSWSKALDELDIKHFLFQNTKDTDLGVLRVSTDQNKCDKFKYLNLSNHPAKFEDI